MHCLKIAPPSLWQTHRSFQHGAKLWASCLHLKINIWSSRGCKFSWTLHINKTVQPDYIFFPTSTGGYSDWRAAQLIFITCSLTRSPGPDFFSASQSSGFLVHQTIVCHMQPVKFPLHFLVKFMKAAVCVALSSQQPLWSHSPLVDCLPNGHWQMGLKIASVTPPAQTAAAVGQRRCRFPIFQLLAARLHHCPRRTQTLITELRRTSSSAFCFFQVPSLFFWVNNR